jgi:peptide/nickel transport system permease protein
MTAYVIRRLLYAIPIILGVMVLTFILFFVLATPQTIARQVLGDKAKQEVVDAWIAMKGLDKPHLFNAKAPGLAKLTDTLFGRHMTSLATFRFGNSWQDDRPIGRKILQYTGPSVAYTAPTFFFGLLIAVSLALILAYFRSTYVDRYGTLLCVLGMSVVIVVYILGFQWILSISWKLVPIAGWAEGPERLRFILLPVVIGVVAGIGGSARFYRTIMIEETTKDYVRTARAKGLAESAVLFKHILKNAMIPILTNSVLAIPFLIMGSLLMETFFSIPGLGRFAVDALFSNDFPSLRAIVFIGAVLYQVGLIMTDISYGLVDPRVTFK